MWSIERRDYKIKQGKSVGDSIDLKIAAEIVLKMEANQSGALFLSGYVDPYSNFGGKADAEMLSCFEYGTEKRLYSMRRILQ